MPCLSSPDGDLPAFARRVCERKISVGADGLFLIEPSNTVDFKWQFFNSDGSMAEMCGNGSRCVARYAYLKGIAGKKMSFETLAGIISAEVNDDVVKVRLTDPSPLRIAQTIMLNDRECILDCIDTGVEHSISEVFLKRKDGERLAGSDVDVEVVDERLVRLVAE